MWLGQSTEEAFDDMCSLSCKHHASNVRRLDDFKEMSERLSQLFCTMKAHVMDNFLFYCEGTPTQEEWVLQSNILPNKLPRIPDYQYISKELKGNIVLIDSVSTFVCSSLLTVCCICNKLHDKDDLLEYFECECSKRYPNTSSVLEDLSYEGGLSFLVILPFYKKTRKNFEGCDENVIQCAILLSFYHFVDTFLDPYIALDFWKDNFIDIEQDVRHATLKKHGNDEYGMQHYERAIEIYTVWLKQYNNYSYVMYGNCAQALLKLGRYMEAELNSRAAIILSPKWSKGYYRLSLSLAGQKNIHAAHLTAELGMRHCEKVADLRELKNTQLAKCSACQQKIIDASKEAAAKGKKKRKSYQGRKGKPKTTNAETNELEVFYSLLKNGFTAMVQLHLPAIAKQHYSDALLQLNSGIKVKNLNLTALKYAYGSSCAACNTVQDLKHAIEIFQELIDGNLLPPAYYQLASVYYKMNNFREALVKLKFVPLNQLLVLPCLLFWPGEDDQIDETKPEVLKGLIEHLIYKCENPPDARCRHKQCSLTPVIYFTDPDFKGFTSIECHEHCLLQYHIMCWNHLKESYNKTDKEFLELKCMTPDCDGIIVKVEKIGKTGAVDKLFEIEDKKSKKNVKQKKSKLEKKFENKELKKKKRQRSVSLCEATEHADSNDENTIPVPEEKSISNSEGIKPETDNIKAIEIEKSKLAEVPPIPSQAVESSDNIKPFYIIKKDDQKAIEPKAPKQKERKKQKKSTYSIDEFCENYGAQDVANLSDYQLRLHRLQETKRVVEESAEWPSFCPPENSVPEQNSEALCDIPEPLDDEVVKEIKNYIYTKFETILQERQTLDLDDPIIDKVLKDIPEEWQKVIEESGGFKRFMLQNMKFAVVGEKLCFFAEMLNLYKSSEITELDAFDLVYGGEGGDAADGTGNCLDEERVSYLNPNATEYSPPTSTNEHNSEELDPILDVENDNSKAQTISFEAHGSMQDISKENAKAGEKSLYNCLTRLRQPLSSYGNLSQSSDKIAHQTGSDKEKQQKKFVEEEFLSKIQKLKLHLNGSEVTWDTLDCLRDTAVMLSMADDVNQVMDCVRSSEMSLCNKKEDKCQQVGPSQGELVSQGVMKEDEETQEQMENLIHENCQLSERKEAVEAQLTECLDTNAQLQNRLTIELPALERSLAEAEMAKKEDCKLLKAKITTLEKEIKQWRQKHDLIVEGEKEIRKENTKLQFKMNNHMVRIEELNGKCEDYEKKLSNQSKVVETCEKIVHDNNQRMEIKIKQADEAIRRAYDAELNLLKFKREVYLKRLDQILLEGSLRIEEFRKNKERCEYGNALLPQMSAKLTEILNHLKQYSEQISMLRIQTAKKANELIEKAESGTPLSELGQFDFPELPLLPDVIKELSSMPPPTQVNPPNIAPNVPPMVSFPAQVAAANMMPIGVKPGLLPPPWMGGSPSVTWNAATNSYVVNPLQQAQAMVGNRNTFANRPLTPNQLLAAGLNPSAAPSVYDYRAVPNPLIAPGVPPPGMSLLGNTGPPLRRNLQKDNVGATNSKKDAVRLETDEQLPFPLLSNQEDKASSKGSSVSLAAAAPDADETSSTDSYQSSNWSHSKTPVLDSSHVDVPRFAKDVKDISKDKSIAALSTIELGYVAPSDPCPSAQPSKPQPQRVRALIKTTEKKGGYAKILDRLKVKYPQTPEKDLLGFLMQYRDAIGKLTGLSFDSIALGVSELISRNSRLAANIPALQTRPKSLVNKAIVTVPPPEEYDMKETGSKENPWGNPSPADNNGWAGNGAERGCIICLEDEMLLEESQKMECGHRFHKHCIKQWLCKMSTCPICRVLILLPEDYPTLA